MHGFGDGAQYGTYQLGRLTYRTPNEARGAARDLGLSGVHEHSVSGETVFSPGKDCDDLAAGLEAAGLPPSERCSTSGGMMGDAGLMGSQGMSTGMDFGDDIPTMEELDESDKWGF